MPLAGKLPEVAGLKVQIAATHQTLLRALPVAVLDEHGKQRECVEVDPLTDAQRPRREAVDRLLELAERPALIRVLRRGDQCAHIVRLVLCVEATGLARTLTGPRIGRAVLAVDDDGKDGIGVEAQRPHQPRGRHFREHFAVSVPRTVIVLEAQRFALRGAATEFRGLSPQLEAPVFEATLNRSASRVRDRRWQRGRRTDPDLLRRERPGSFQITAFAR